MRALLINGRDDALQNPGGDTVQLSKTRDALEELGVDAQVKQWNQLEALDNPNRYDIAHLFNIQMPDTAWTILETLKRYQLATVLSPIYWDLYPFWFMEASRSKPLWKIASRYAGTKLASTIYIHWQRGKSPLISWWRTQRRLLQHATRLLPNSNAETELLKDTFFLGPGLQAKVDVVPNAIDPALFDPKPEPSHLFQEKIGSDKFILQVGTIHPVKNQLGLMKALYDLPLPILFVGRPIASTTDYAEQCKAFARERGNVTFIDRIPHEQLPNIYATASVHVLPSWRETPGLVSMEAAASGCPIVSTSIGSAREYFGDMAWYCHPDDLKSIRDSVEAALQAPPNPGLRQRILTQYTWANTAQCTLDAYQKALN